MKKEQKILKLKSVDESLHQLESLIEEVCDTNKLNHNYLGCITVSVTEAFNNAMIHGNKNNPEKTITVAYEKTSTGVSFSVKDEGMGFNYKSIPDVTDDGKEKTFPGRGLFLIKTLSDHINFNEKGNEIRMGFKTTSINIETSVDRLEKFKEFTSPKTIESN